MLAKRIIPCLDIKDGQTVKGVNFTGLRNVGDPVELAAGYAAEGADEIVCLDISATLEGRKTFASLVERIAEVTDIPVTVGGGVNSAAVLRPELIDEIASKYGSQFIVAAIDAKKIDGKWTVTTHSGSRPTDRELFSWARETVDRGAGEILFTSMDNDGTGSGYPCEVYAALSEMLPVPVIASGGAGSVEDIARVLTDGRADAALAASIFHYGKISIPQLKARLADMGIPVRPVL